MRNILVSRHIRSRILVFIFALLCCSTLLTGLPKTASAMPTTVRVFAKDPEPCTDKTFEKTFFGLPVWYKYLKPYARDTIDGCSFDFGRNNKNPDGTTNTVESTSAIVLIGMALIEILLRIVGVAAVAFVIVGGYRYALAQGEPEKIKAAQNTVVNALIGVVIAIAASAVVAFVGNKLAGG